MNKPGDKKVLVEFRVRLTMEVPEAWDADAVNFWLNESSHCSGNLVEQLHREVNAREGACDVCSRSVAFYVRDAAADESAENHPTDWEPEGRP